MKRLFTPLFKIILLIFLNTLILNAQTFTWDKSELTTAWANASAASTLKTSGGITLQQIGTTGTATSYMALDNSNPTPVLNATGNDAITITSSTDPISSIKISYCSNGSSNIGSPYLGYSTTATPMGSASVSISACDLDATGVTGTTAVQKTYTPPSGTKFIILTRGKACGSVSAMTGTIRISRIEVYTTASTPTITSFTVSGVSAIINETAKTITAELPYGSALSNLTPTVTIGGTATGYSPTGAQDFSKGAVNYTATDGTNNVVYAVTLTAAATVAAPVITSPANKNQNLKAGTKISDIIFTLKNATGASVSGLPSGIASFYKNDSCTISGKVDSTAAPGTYTYTLKATPLDGYTGNDITASGTIVVKDTLATRILYLATSTVTTANDLFLNQLNSSSKYLVTQRAPIAGFTGNYDNYDLIVLHESLTGGDAATAGHELNLIKTVDKPILNTKSYFYTAGTTPRWGWGTPNNGNSGKGIVVVQPSHPIFDGITLGDSLFIYNTATAKNIQPVTGVTVGGYQIAKVTGGIAIHDVPASVRLGAGKTSKYLMISLLSAKFNDLTADALKLLDNAIHYLLSGTQFAAPSLEIASFKVDTANAIIVHSPATISLVLPTGTDLTALKPTIELSGIGTTVSPASGIATNFSTSGTTAVNYTVTDGINTKVYAVSITNEPAGVAQLKLKGVYFDGQTVHNDNQSFLQVYNAVGSPVSSSYSDINMTLFSKGIYIVKCNSGSLKIAVLK